MRKTVLKTLRYIAFARPIGLMGLAWLLLVSVTARAQWKQLPMHYHTSLFGCIYFLDSIGLPQTGFISGDSIYKTTDGGYTWRGSFNWDIPNDFAFKNADTGWASYSGGLLKTTDGGNTWTGKATMPEAYDVYYDRKDGGLFVTGDFATADLGIGIWVSWDDGTTWSIAPGSNGFGEAAFSFWNDDTGVAAPFCNGGPCGMGLTTDGGKTWNWVAGNAGDNLYQLVAVPGTTTGFAIDQFGVVRRTDDFWHTCHAVYHFPPEYSIWGGKNSIYPSNMCITGNLQNLFVMLDSGCFRSTDQGKTWKYLCGVLSPATGADPDINRFYANGSKVFISSENYGTHYWMLNVDSMQYFPTGIALADGSKRTTVLPGKPVTVDYSPETSDSIGVDTGHLIFRFDSDALSLHSIILPSSWIILDSSSIHGELRLTISAESNISIPNPMVSLTFNTYLSSPSAKIYLDSAYLSGKRLNCDCQALSTPGPDSVEIDFAGCGDSLLLAAMNHEPPFSIERIVPNPASASVRVDGSGQGVEAGLDDVLGRQILSPTPYTLPFTFDVSQIPAGIYILRLNSGDYAISRRIAIKR